MNSLTWVKIVWKNPQKNPTYKWPQYLEDSGVPHFTFKKNKKAKNRFKVQDRTYQYAANKENLKHCRPQIKHQGTEHKADASCTPINGFRESSCLSAQVETKVQIMQM